MHMQNRIAGAVMDFAAYLTTQDPITVGGTHHPQPMIEALEAWAQERGLSLEQPALDRWSTDPLEDEDDPARVVVAAQLVTALQAAERALQDAATRGPEGIVAGSLQAVQQGLRDIEHGVHVLQAGHRIIYSYRGLNGRWMILQRVGTSTDAVHSVISGNTATELEAWQQLLGERCSRCAGTIDASNTPLTVCGNCAQAIAALERRTAEPDDMQTRLRNRLVGAALHVAALQANGPGGPGTEMQTALELLTQVAADYQTDRASTDAQAQLDR